MFKNMLQYYQNVFKNTLIVKMFKRVILEPIGFIIIVLIAVCVIIDEIKENITSGNIK